jgi:hypothetical protein
VPAVVASVVVFIAILALAYFFLVVRRRRKFDDRNAIDKNVFDYVSKYTLSGAELEVRNTRIYDERLEGSMINPGFGNVKSPVKKVKKVNEFVTASGSEYMANPLNKQATASVIGNINNEEQTSNLSATFQSNYLAYDDDNA